MAQRSPYEGLTVATLRFCSKLEFFDSLCDWPSNKAFSPPMYDRLAVVHQDGSSGSAVRATSTSTAVPFEDYDTVVIGKLPNPHI